MGVKNLWDILESCKQTLPLHHLQNKKLCVDLSCWIVQLYTANRSPTCIRDKVYLRNLFHRLRALIALNCTLVFVADGSIPSLKLSTYRKRLGILNSNSELHDSQEETTSQPHAAPSLKRNMGSMFSRMIKEAKTLGMALGVPCLEGLEEAEAQCALLNSASMCDGCFSADSDIFLFGAKTVFRDIVLGDGGHVVCYEMLDIEKKLGLGRNSLITLALFLGSDYNGGMRGFGPEAACQIVKSIGDSDILKKVVSEGFKFEKNIKRTKQKKKPDGLKASDANKENELSQRNNGIGGNKPKSALNGHLLQVIDAYMKPKCHSVDSEAVQRATVQYPFQRHQLQRICAEYFDWDTKKTDEYILPKVAERDLRRFANLRVTASQAGCQIPFDKIPVRCPVSSIVKQRKMQGRECYEVSWQGIDGLDTSVVPADLLLNACPEKISEFMDTVAERKKEKRKERPRKPKVASEANSDPQDLLGSIVPESNSSNTSNVCESTSIGKMDPVMIDLLSPSPPIRACKSAKFQEDIRHHIDEVAIDLSNYKIGTFEETGRSTRDSRDYKATYQCQVSTSSCIDIIDEQDYALEEQGRNVAHDGDYKAAGLCHSSNRCAELIDLSDCPVREEKVTLADFGCGIAERCGDSAANCVHILDEPDYPVEERVTDTSVCSDHKDENCCRDSDVNCSVIEILDSDSDASPESQRKAREFQSFLDRIQHELY